MLKQLVKVSKEDIIFLKQILLDSIAVLFPKKPKVADLVTANSPKVGIRMPDHDLARGIISKFKLITSTSVNLTGEEPITKAKDIDLAVDLVIKEKSQYNEPSTLIDLETRKILRKGIEYEKIKKILDL